MQTQFVKIILPLMCNFDQIVLLFLIPYVSYSLAICSGGSSS